jgi:N-acetyl-anhydromuramyl-L-alanine amidase AmpD
MLVNAAWMPPCVMKRIILHWTAGAHRASALDVEHYHILIQGDGTLVRGTHPIDANASASGPRASHTLNCNTQSIGVAVCCMSGARESPFDAGPFPMTERQWAVLAQVAAELCERYAIPVTSETVLAHGEVQANLHIKQKGKWDPLVLPWSVTLRRTDVMEKFRATVRAHQAALRVEPPELPPAGPPVPAEGEVAMPDDVSFASTEFYHVIAGQQVTLEVFTGDGQASGTSLLLNGQPHPFIEGTGPQPIGSNLGGSVLHARTLVRDTREDTNRTSVTYELRGGAQDRRFPYTIEVSADKGSAHYLIAFVFTKQPL